MAAPKADAPRCDVPGCGRMADRMTDGTEKDTHKKRVGESTVNPDGTIEPGIGKDEPLNRPALPCLNVCAKHANWPHSDDAKAWAAMPENAAKYAARKGAK